MTNFHPPARDTFLTAYPIFVQESLPGEDPVEAAESRAAYAECLRLDAMIQIDPCARRAADAQLASALAELKVLRSRRALPARVAAFRSCARRVPSVRSTHTGRAAALFLRTHRACSRRHPHTQAVQFCPRRNSPSTRWTDRCASASMTSWCATAVQDGRPQAHPPPTCDSLSREGPETRESASDYAPSFRQTQPDGLRLT